MADVLFAALLPGARFMIECELVSITPVTGERVCNLLNSATGEAMGTTTISPATGTTSGHIDTPATAKVRVVKQVFVAGDIIREANGSTHVVASMAGDNVLAFTNAAGDQGYPSSEVVKVGHVDPATLTP